MRLSLATALTAALLLTGCAEEEKEPSEGLADGPISGETTDATVVSTGTGADEGCAYLATGAVADALGEDASLTASGPTTCLFGHTGSGVGVTVTVTRIAVDVDGYVTGTRELCEDDPVVVDVGDDAFVCTTFAGPQGFVFGGTDSVLVEVSGAEDDAAAADALTALLPHVTFPG